MKEDKIAEGISSGGPSRYSIVLQIIQEYGEDYEKGIPIKEIFKRASREGISNDFVIDMLEEEKKRGGIYEPKENHFKVVP